MIIVALHGFFGTPDDWSRTLETLDSELESRAPEKSAQDAVTTSTPDNDDEDLSPDLFVPDLAVWATRQGINDFDTFAASFNRSVRLLAEKNQQPVMIAGYSLGARLAAHCILDEPDLYQSALLISMNPGLPQADLEARRQRLAFDASWAEKMRRDQWDKTWEAWNQQEVLKPGSRGLLRSGQTAAAHAASQTELSRKLEGRREAWARAMEIWSLGHQQDLRGDLLEWADDGHRLTIMTGTDDAKFTQLTSAWLKATEAGGIGHETVRHRHVLGSGHRILIESPEDVVSEVATLVTDEI